MRYDEATALHVELLQSLPGGGGDSAEALSRVVGHHTPAWASRFRPPKPDDYARCQGCDPGDYADASAEWPCSTIEIVNAYAHVQGLPTP